MSAPLPAFPEADQHHLRAAEGWLGLGDWQSANDELEEITPQLRAHPEVLEVRWQVYAAAKRWVMCVEIATAITKLVPERAFGWLHRSFALHELKRTAEAREGLLAVVERFPAEATMHYNLACYECQLGNLVEARKWLAQALALDDSDDFKRAALDDPDLDPLWTEEQRKQS
jgi:predicted Zn-dependent protease